MAQVSRTRRMVPEGPSEPDGTLTLTPEGPLVTPGFHPLADFANFGPDEAMMLLESGADLDVFTKAIAGQLCSYLSSRLPRAGISGATVDRDAVEEWLSRSSTGPFDEGFANYLRELTHVGGGATFPGVNVPLPPQMIVGLMGWLQGELLFALGDVSDTITLSGIGGIWMDELMLQLGIMLEPVLTSPEGPRDYSSGHQAELHPYADLAGFGPSEGKILGETGSLLAPAASGVISLAYTYLLSRPESAGFFSESEHLAQRKQTLKAWWIRTSADPFESNGGFGDYMRKVANAHVLNAGTHPSVEIPPQLTIALMGWVEMRVMTALNTIALDPAGAATFGELGDPGALAAVGRAWMLMLTLQLGVLIDPYLTT
ncbi:MAG TPA: protoglobin domain-containing protein [Actinomycetota bacterium]|nr:protoglobin domain-containing protein [Actinomycetota bacterium]